MQQRIEEVRARTARAAAAASLLRRMGQATDRVADLGCGIGRSRWRWFLGRPGRQISAEEVARMDPDILIAAWCGAGDRVPLEKIVARPQLAGNSRCARPRRVYCIRDEYLNTPAPTLLRGLDALAFAIHPEMFDSTEGIRQITGVPSSTACESARCELRFAHAYRHQNRRDSPRSY